MSQAYYLMDFVGGPFDGFDFSLERSPEDQYLFIPVAGSTDLRLNSAALAKGAKPTSLAIYELHSSPHGWSYHFLCSESPYTVPRIRSHRKQDSR